MANTKTLSVLTLTWVLLVSLPDLTHAVRCYQCISSPYGTVLDAPHLSPQAGCGDPFSSSRIETCTGNYCVKSKATITVNSRRITGVARGCSALCFSTRQNNHVLSCCRGDKCNTSPVTSASVLVTAVTCLLQIGIILAF